MNIEHTKLITSKEQVATVFRQETFLKRMQRMEDVLTHPDQERIIKIDSKQIPFKDAISIAEAKILIKRVALSLVLSAIDNNLDQVDYNGLVRGEFNAPPPVIESPNMCPEGHGMLPQFSPTRREIMYYRCNPCGLTKWNREL